MSPYVAAKHAVIGLTKSAAIDYAKSGIRVNALAPGLVRTPMTERWLADPAMREAVLSGPLMGRAAEPEDMVRTVLYLCSSMSSFATGQTFTIDGGQTAHLAVARAGGTGGIEAFHPGVIFQGRRESKCISYRLLTSQLTSVPNSVRPRHVGDRSRVLRTRDLSASFLQSKRSPPWRGAPSPARCARRSPEINAHPGIDSLQSAHQRQTTERLSGRRVIDVAADGSVWFVARWAKF
jgi:hypothetical protein